MSEQSYNSNTCTGNPTLCKFTNVYANDTRGNIFTVNQDSFYDILLVGGGGGGGNNAGSGGGGGDVIEILNHRLNKGEYKIKVGDGGYPGNCGMYNECTGGNGSNGVTSSITSNNKGIFIAIGLNGNIMSSTNGINWNVNKVVDNDLYCIFLPV
jgi:hypothetical protein